MQTPLSPDEARVLRALFLLQLCQPEGVLATVAQDRIDGSGTTRHVAALRRYGLVYVYSDASRHTRIAVNFPTGISLAMDGMQISDIHAAYPPQSEAAECDDCGVSLDADNAVVTRKCRHCALV